MSSTGKENSKQLVSVSLIGYFAAAVSVSMFVIAVFSGNDTFLHKQQFYWFILAIIALLLPHIKQIRFKDVEVKLHEHDTKLQDVELRLIETVEAQAAPTTKDIQDAEAAKLSTEELDLLRALNNPRWKYRTATGVFGEVKGKRALGIERDNIKSELKALRGRGFVDRVTGTEGRMFWRLTGLGREILNSRED